MGGPGAGVVPLGRGARLRQQAARCGTAVLAALAAAGGGALLFLVPLYVDPALSALAADFPATPVTCTTVRREERNGLMECGVASCREGCTADLYKCTRVHVRYEAEGRSRSALLLINIKGCGYPPTVDCKNFTETYGVEGMKFPCYWSRAEQSVVLPHYDRAEQVAVVARYLAAPLVLTLATSAALCALHCDCRAPVRHRRPRPRPSSRRRPRPTREDLRSVSVFSFVNCRFVGCFLLDTVD